MVDYCPLFNIFLNHTVLKNRGVANSSTLQDSEGKYFIHASIFKRPNSLYAPAFGR